MLTQYIQRNSGLTNRKKVLSVTSIPRALAGYHLVDKFRKTI